MGIQLYEAKGASGSRRQSSFSSIEPGFSALTIIQRATHPFCALRISCCMPLETGATTALMQTLASSQRRLLTHSTKCYCSRQAKNAPALHTPSEYTHHEAATISIPHEMRGSLAGRKVTFVENDPLDSHNIAQVLAMRGGGFGRGMQTMPVSPPYIRFMLRAVH